MVTTIIIVVSLFIGILLLPPILAVLSMWFEYWQDRIKYQDKFKFKR
jgi:hypothetical protein